jgi:MerR family transcriptional regulator, thiopeptide resistance regulator
MAYTVKQVARLSGVSVRTLHFYDEVGLLKPAWIGVNGYRHYEQSQLLTLQQILFYRELGFELKEIKRILGRKSFERVAALKSHRKVLERDIERKRALLGTIEKTIEHLRGKKMKANELFVGFSPEVQAKHEQYLIERFGDDMRDGIEQSKKRVKNWTKADWQKSGDVFNGICRDLTAALEKKLSAESSDVQAIVQRHFEWLKAFWTPNRESYPSHAQMIVDSELRRAYEAHHAQLPEFIAAGIKAFAERELA